MDFLTTAFLAMINLFCFSVLKMPFLSVDCIVMFCFCTSPGYSWMKDGILLILALLIFFFVAFNFFIFVFFFFVA